MAAGAMMRRRRVRALPMRVVLSSSVLAALDYSR
jgi:hypothetical protein